MATEINKGSSGKSIESYVSTDLPDEPNLRT